MKHLQNVTKDLLQNSSLHSLSSSFAHHLCFWLFFEAFEVLESKLCFWTKTVKLEFRMKSVFFPHIIFFQFGSRKFFWSTLLLGSAWVSCKIWRLFGREWFCFWNIYWDSMTYIPPAEDKTVELKEQLQVLCILVFLDQVIKARIQIVWKMRADKIHQR